ncbi:hypothetical protein Tco_0623788 [Tanacetum coccineum]|uniref:Uncharacterized protein n=1 Tax=Tanacetum coccineum TaxID=301880 RepID=A0ABQ4WC69_9ASTR
MSSSGCCELRMGQNHHHLRLIQSAPLHIIRLELSSSKSCSSFILFIHLELFHHRSWSHHLHHPELVLRVASGGGTPGCNPGEFLHLHSVNHLAKYPRALRAGLSFFMLPFVFGGKGIVPEAMAAYINYSFVNIDQREDKDNVHRILPFFVLGFVLNLKMKVLPQKICIINILLIVHYPQDLSFGKRRRLSDDGLPLRTFTLEGLLPLMCHLDCKANITSTNLKSASAGGTNAASKAIDPSSEIFLELFKKGECQLVGDVGCWSLACGWAGVIRGCTDTYNMDIGSYGVVMQSNHKPFAMSHKVRALLAGGGRRRNGGKGKERSVSERKVMGGTEEGNRRVKKKGKRGSRKGEGNNSQTSRLTFFIKFHGDSVGSSDVRKASFQ